MSEAASPSRRKLVIKIGAALLGLVVFYFVVTFVQVWMASRSDDTRVSDAIIVLGAAQYDGRPSPVFAARLDHAAELYQEGVAPTVVVTGGKQEGDRFTEAAAGADYLAEHGVPEDAIVRETTSRSSWESLSASAAILEDRGTTRVVLVSDPFHSFRIEAIAEELGLDAVTSPTRSSPIGGWTEFRYLLGETLRVGVGRIVGFGRLARNSDRVGIRAPGVAILIGPSGVV